MSIDEKLYQVFVSSTYDDLIEERREVMQALLELDCIPAGMELFLAATDDQWTIIKRVIDRCDYYIVIVGDRYGSTGQSGSSYTRMEYEYALEQGIPTLAFFRKNLETLAPAKREKNLELKHKLDEFKNLLQKKHIRYFDSPAELGSVVSRSIVKLRQSNPAIGWIRANVATSKTSLQEINSLQKENAELREKIVILENKPEFQIDNLAELNEVFNIIGEYTSASYTQKWDLRLSWRELFGMISPYLLQSLHVDSVNYTIAQDALKKLGKSGYSLKVDMQNFNTITIQLKALGLINVKSLNTNKGGLGLFWSLTKKGEELMMKTRAVTSSKNTDK